MSFMDLVGTVERVEPFTHDCASHRNGKVCKCDISDWVLVSYPEHDPVLFRASELKEL